MNTGGLFTRSALVAANQSNLDTHHSIDEVPQGEAHRHNCQSLIAQMGVRPPFCTYGTENAKTNVAGTPITSQ